MTSQEVHHPINKEAKVLVTIEELAAYADTFVTTLTKGEQALVVALSGELGAGKTAFTKELARVLGVTETITSPTFVIEKIYEIPTHPFLKHLIHIDAYRLEHEQELEVLKWRTIVKDPQNLIVVEWPERVPKLIPDSATLVTFRVETDGSRHVSHNRYDNK